MSAEVVWTWVAAGLTLSMFSFLYRDNPFFKLGEHLYVGVTVGYMLTVTWFEYLHPKLWLPLVVGTETGHDWSLLVPAFFGLLVLTRFVPSLAWLSRWSFALLVGFGAGVSIPRYISSNILSQVEGTVVPLWAGHWGAAVTTGVILVGVISTLVYFFFSVEHRGAIRVVSRVGVYFLMVSFGASFGATVMGRNALLFGRFYDLVDFAGARYYHATLVLLAVMVVSLAVWARWAGRGGGSEAPQA
ncbi:MAG: hypothetical protein HY722_10305 [Planctomycetes bacterium]|nr:hypothetical protein [Planctomycetota bacterium]